MQESVLSTENLKKSFGGLVVAEGIHFRVGKNEARCIIGPNGAGKTTFFNLVTGLLSSDSGSIRIENKDVTRLPVNERQKLGLVRTFQAPRIFPLFSVFDNVLLALQANRRFGSLIKCLFPNKNDTEEIQHAMEQTGLLHVSDRLAGSLSHGEKKRVEMAMAIVQKPKVLLMDEPTAGMTVKETQEIADLVNQIRRQMSVVIVEHDMEFVREIADVISVLYKGNLVREGTLHELENDPFIQEIYLGSVAL
ncbi:hypothetical protein VN24_14955 [Paenibacillus beijingensis]|uniref:ABC transporter domain-containing protein n=1 Tax=Paenibacillus beijingensis TaxID=1126833 RepID=A0A0D5NRZ3_9BACL|nr:hypothetical protein VN24_14955 [Paenibacillus beijingensis]